MDAQNPILTIIVPAYNVRQYLEKNIVTVVSAAKRCAQLIGRLVEVIYIDDGATDGSAVFLDEYTRIKQAGDGVDFKVIHQENGGVSVARNTGLDAASGEWVHFVDADDWVGEELYDELISVTKDDPQSDMVVFTATFLKLDGSVEKQFGGDIASADLAGDEVFLPRYRCFAGCIWNKIYRLDLIREIGLRFVIGVQPSEDDLFNQLYLTYAKRVLIRTEILGYFYRATPGSSVHTMSVKKLMYQVGQFDGLYERWLSVHTPGLCSMLSLIARRLLCLTAKAKVEDRRFCAETLASSEIFLKKVVPHALRCGTAKDRIVAFVCLVLPKMLRIDFLTCIGKVVSRG